MLLIALPSKIYKFYCHRINKILFLHLSSTLIARYCDYRIAVVVLSVYLLKKNKYGFGHSAITSPSPFWFNLFVKFFFFQLFSKYSFIINNPFVNRNVLTSLSNVHILPLFYYLHPYLLLDYFYLCLWSVIHSIFILISLYFFLLFNFIFLISSLIYLTQPPVFSY